MTQPGLNLGNISFVLKSVGGSEPMGAQAVDLNPGLFRVGRDDCIDAVGRDTGAGQFTSQRHEQWHLPLGQMMPRAFQVLVNAPGRDRMQRQISHLAALAMHLQMLDPASLLDIAHLQQRRFFAAQPVIEKNRQ